uniref:Uncharacterized protein n=1 Tax=Oryza meridionalis TaxID=40149 RepID=A0A0E0FBS4_9ORYZ
MGRKRRARVSRDGDGGGEEEQEEDEEPVLAAVESKSLYEVPPAGEFGGSLRDQLLINVQEDARTPDLCERKAVTNSVVIQEQDFTFDARVDAQPEQAHTAGKSLVVPLTPEEAEVEVETAGTGDDDEEEKEEYVSDTDDAPLPEMRCREASDDRFQEENRGRRSR